jgi:hypothetical protein
MKGCSWCGHENEDGQGRCSSCGTVLPVDEGQAIVSAWTPDPPDAEVAVAMSELDWEFEMVAGFSRPDWKQVSRYVRSHFSPEELSEAWRFIGQKWLEELARNLGGEARIYKSPQFNFLCLSDIHPVTIPPLLEHAEACLALIRSILGAAAWKGYHGKHVLLIFAEEDDYLAYVSYYYPEGEHALSGGMFIHDGYGHIALPQEDVRLGRDVIAHELTHNLLCHLTIPLWLNEGLAKQVEHRVSGGSLRLDQDLAKRHAAYWNEFRIQEFWAGNSFYMPDEGSSLSYSLAEILVNLLREDGAKFGEFVLNAKWPDAGQESAIAILDRDLGEATAEFLGPGNWGPRRRAIAEIAKK